MKFPGLLLVSAVAYLSFVQGQVSLKTNSICTTFYGRKSVSPKSSGFALTIPLVYRRDVTVTPTYTVTPSPVTSTDTKTTTVTNQDSTTITITTTFTSLTTVESTTTVPTPAGFTPILNSPGYVPKKRAVENGLRIRAAASPCVPRIGRGEKYPPGLYPTSTLCASLVRAIRTSTRTFTAKTTVTTTAIPVTKIVTTIVPETTTSISVDNAVFTTTTTTATVTTSVTSTSTSTSTSSTTETVSVPSATAYAVCQSNNRANAANGNQGIYVVFQDTGPIITTQTIGGVANAESCCNECAKVGGVASCGGYAFFSGTCYLFDIGPNCQASNTFSLFETGSGYAAGTGYTVGNGPCGRIGNGGSGS
ncbi:MAG: hypothetical protein M1833_001036 [Piccolia ochrophora]|nr:MAG: hypothetical protein M1833_001036 [Piccolia ochrophora]